MKERIFIEGQDIYLRPVEKSDVDGNYINWFDDIEVCRYNSHHRFPYTKESLVQYVEELNNTRDKIVLAIVEKNEKKHIGNISIQGIDFINGCGELAIILGEKNFWRRGYALEAGKLIIEHAFLNINLNRIDCATFYENIGMRKLAGSLGFKEEGIKRKAVYKNGQYNDIVEFGLLKSEWLGSKIFLEDDNNEKNF